MVGLFSVSLRIASSSEMRDNSPQLDKMGKKNENKRKNKNMLISRGAAGRGGPECPDQRYGLPCPGV